MDTIFAVLTSPLICLGWIIIGAIAGALARRIMGSANYPFFQDVLLGILGAIVGGWLAGFVGGLAGINFYGNAVGLELVLINLVVATIGAIILITLRRMISRRA